MKARIPIPQDEHPDINFKGLLIGPKALTIRGLEKITGTKIKINGKGINEVKIHKYYLSLYLFAFIILLDLTY